jgi:pimeloyl-ACP methyl ester carboxylesterase
MPYPLIRLGGRGETLLFLPANGFPPAAYQPMLEPLLARWSVVSLPPRALWEDAGPPPPTPDTWHGLADDLLEGMARHNLAGVNAVGHSFGAVALLLAAIREPSRFSSLVLLDPTLLPPDDLAGYAEERRSGTSSSRPLVQGARKRRDRFADRAEAFAYWRSRPLFADWSDAALQRYVEAALIPDPDGGLRLRWPREWEAWYYESVTDGWEELPRLRPDLPVLVVRGERSDTFTPESAERLRELLPHIGLQTTGGGHLFPLAQPEAAARLLLEWR